MIVRLMVLSLTLATSATLAEPTVTAPASAGIGSEVTVTVSGTTNPRDFVTMAKAGTPTDVVT